MEPRTAVAVIVAWLTLAGTPSTWAAETVYQAPQDFLESTLPGCAQNALWLKPEDKAAIREVLGRPFPGIRARYCSLGDRTAWILDEIGKTEAITTGIVVTGGRVEQVRVLVFRESRGDEVHRAAFTRQYEAAGLDERGRLDRPIDGITGATLSVRAVNHQVKTALALDRIVQEKHGDH